MKPDELKNIFVTQPALPDIEEVLPLLKDIWERKILTNSGPLHEQLEKDLAEFLGVKYISLFANGTLALITALQALKVTGEVITTPYSFVATANSLWWNNIKPVFVDIEHRYCNLNPEKIESAITTKTTAIMPVHVYGNPCDVERIQDIADIYGLKVIYDAAHAFGVKLGENSILNYGDLSILSFHATKVFNTMEGGAIISHDEITKKRIDYLKNFGFADEVTVVAPGINSKMNEFQAALGLVQLRHHDNNIEKRKIVNEYYTKRLKGVNGISLLNKKDGVTQNYSYFPIFIDEEEFGISRDELYNKLKSQNIFVRRYFYPIISSFPMYKNHTYNKILTQANTTSKSVICLPIYPELETKQMDRIINVIISK